MLTFTADTGLTGFKRFCGRVIRRFGGKHYLNIPKRVDLKMICERDQADSLIMYLFAM